MSDSKAKKLNVRMFNFRLPNELDIWLGQEAEREHTSKAGIIRRLIMDAMKAESKRGA